MAKVTFDGPNKLIIVDNGVTSLDVKVDLYSDWKEWMVQGDNSKYLPAFSIIGGEPTGPGTYAGYIVFVMNGWKIRPYEGSHTLTINGNIVGEGGAAIIVPTLGSYTVTVQYTFSSLAQGIATSGSTITAADVADEVWGRTPGSMPASGIGEYIAQKLITVGKFLGLS